MGCPWAGPGLQSGLGCGARWALPAGSEAAVVALQAGPTQLPRVHSAELGAEFPSFA